MKHPQTQKFLGTSPCDAEDPLGGTCEEVHPATRCGASSPASAAILDTEADVYLGRMGNLPSGWVDELAGSQRVSDKNLTSLGSTGFLIYIIKILDPTCTKVLNSLY